MGVSYAYKQKQKQNFNLSYGIGLWFSMSQFNSDAVNFMFLKEMKWFSIWSARQCYGFVLYADVDWELKRYQRSIFRAKTMFFEFPVPSNGFVAVP